MSHRTIKANLDNKLRCLLLWREGRDLRAAHGLFMAERLHLLPPFILGAKKKKETGRARSRVSLYRHLTCSSMLILPGTSRVCTGETERMGSWILYFGSIAVLRWSIVQSMWLKASSVMVKLYFWLNIEYLLLFHHHSRSCDQATGLRQDGCLVPVCVQHLHAAWTKMALGYLHQDLILGLLEVQAFITHASPITRIPPFSPVFMQPV